MVSYPKPPPLKNGEIRHPYQGESFEDGQLMYATSLYVRGDWDLEKLEDGIDTVFSGHALTAVMHVYR